MSYRPKMIAEIGSNHCGDMARAFQLIASAKGLGFGAVKFQAIRADMYAEPLQKDDPRILPPRLIRDLARQARVVGIDFGLTVFAIEDVDQYQDLVAYWKISSYDWLREDLVRSALATAIPVLISAGLMNDIDLKSFCERFKHEILGGNLTILHCVSEYPAEAHRVGLERLNSNFANCPVDGYSDHTVSDGVIHRAVWEFGADPIELHFDLDDQEGLETRHSWRETRAKTLMGDLAAGYIATGRFGVNPKERAWRADPSDGKRPLQRFRENNGK